MDRNRKHRLHYSCWVYLPNNSRKWPRYCHFIFAYFSFFTLLCLWKIQTEWTQVNESSLKLSYLLLPVRLSWKYPSQVQVKILKALSLGSYCRPICLSVNVLPVKLDKIAHFKLCNISFADFQFPSSVYGTRVSQALILQQDSHCHQSREEIVSSSSTVKFPLQLCNICP